VRGIAVAPPGLANPLGIYCSLHWDFPVIICSTYNQVCTQCLAVSRGTWITWLSSFGAVLGLGGASVVRLGALSNSSAAPPLDLGLTNLLTPDPAAVVLGLWYAFLIPRRRGSMCMIGVLGPCKPRQSHDFYQNTMMYDDESRSADENNRKQKSKFVTNLWCRVSVPQHMFSYLISARRR
jgi:hypothetical protein